MSWKIDPLHELGVIRVTTSGSMTLADIRQMSMAALAAGKAHSMTLFLVDHREMLPSMTSEDIFDLHEINARLGMDGKVRAAIVYSADSAGKDDFFFYEVHTLARGTSNIRMFTDQLQAMDWLTD